MLVDISADEKRRALHHALQSRTFSRSDQLRNFLRFVCEEEIEGRIDRLTESIIGIEVLGRPKDFTPVDDSSVRTRAYELRHRLEKLYSLESPGQTTRIVIPKGSYVPAYERVETIPAMAISGVDVPDSQPVASSASPRAWPTRWLAATAGLGLLAGLAIAFGWNVAVRHAPAGQADPVIREAWGPFASAENAVLLCVATPLHLTVGPGAHTVKGKPYYPAPPEAYPLFQQTRPLAEGGKLGLLFTDNVIGFGTMKAVNAATNRLKEMGISFEIFPERVAPMPTFRNRSVMLFGAPVDSEAITRALENAPLTVDFDAPSNEFVVRYRDTGKMLVPTKDSQGEYLEVYGLVTVINTRQSSAGPLGMVIFSGITSTGTQGAAEFFASAESLRQLKANFGAVGSSGFPPAYQVVVKCRFGNRLLLSYEAIDQRILQNASQR